MSKKVVVVIDNEKNDDWMKSLPGYRDEVAITEAATSKKQPTKIKVKVKHP